MAKLLHASAPRAAALAARPAAAAPRRAARAAPRASAGKEAELAKMQEFKASLSKTLEAASKPGAGGAAPAADASAADLFEVGTANWEAEVVNAPADQLVVVDCYTDWCGPCKMIKPQLVEMADALAPKGVRIVKFNCNSTNKELGKQLKVKVAPTFILFRGGQRVAEMSGAKVDLLKELIEKHR